MFRKKQLFSEKGTFIRAKHKRMTPDPLSPSGVGRGDSGKKVLRLLRLAFIRYSPEIFQRMENHVLSIDTAFVKSE